MPVPPSQRLFQDSAASLPRAWLPFAWLLLVVLAFGANSTSFGAKAAADSGFNDQIEHLLFACNSDSFRLQSRSGETLSDVDGGSDPQWPAVAPGEAGAVLLAFNRCYTTPFLKRTPRASHCQHAPRAPPSL